MEMNEEEEEEVVVEEEEEDERVRKTPKWLESRCHSCSRYCYSSSPSPPYSAQIDRGQGTWYSVLRKETRKWGIATRRFRLPTLRAVSGYLFSGVLLPTGIGTEYGVRVTLPRESVWDGTCA